MSYKLLKLRAERTDGDLYSFYTESVEDTTTTTTDVVDELTGEVTGTETVTTGLGTYSDVEFEATTIDDAEDMKVKVMLEEKLPFTSLIIVEVQESKIDLIFSNNDSGHVPDQD